MLVVDTHKSHAIAAPFVAAARRLSGPSSSSSSTSTEWRINHTAYTSRTTKKGGKTDYALAQHARFEQRLTLPIRLNHISRHHKRASERGREEEEVKGLHRRFKKRRGGLVSLVGASGPAGRADFKANQNNKRLLYGGKTLKSCSAGVPLSSPISFFDLSSKSRREKGKGKSEREARKRFRWLLHNAFTRRIIHLVREKAKVTKSLAVLSLV